MTLPAPRCERVGRPPRPRLRHGRLHLPTPPTPANPAYTCQPDEAVIVEVTPPDCLYWSFQVASPHWESLDHWRRQTSLNGHQAVLDSDGVFRAVIAHRDPGVHNWLDTAGYTRAPLNGRWLYATEFPEPEMRVVPFDDILDHLPSETVRVSPHERTSMLRRRQSAAQNLRGF